MKKVKLGVVGCGGRGRALTRLFKTHPHCEITALMDRFPRVVEDFARLVELTAVPTYTDYDRMLREADMDAVFFACDPTVQADLACRAMEAGKHVCTEVPAAFTIDDCWRLVKTVEKTGAKYQMMEQARYWGFIDKWKQMHDSGELGHICLAQGEYVHYSHDKAWANWTDLETGKILRVNLKPTDRKVEETWRYKLALAEPIFYLPHTLSPLLKILDDRVATVSCMGTHPPSYACPDVKMPWSDIQYALMHTVKDTVLLVGAGFSLPQVSRGPLKWHWYELRGSKGSVNSPRYTEDHFMRGNMANQTWEHMDLSVVPLDADASQAQSGHGGADFKPVDNFIRAIVEDTTPPMDVYLSVETAAPAILAAESARRGGVLLDVPDFRT